MMKLTNVLSTTIYGYVAGMSGPLIGMLEALDKMMADITDIQDIRWVGQGCSKQACCDSYYSCHVMKRREFGCGFVDSKGLRLLDSRFTAVDWQQFALRPNCFI